MENIKWTKTETGHYVSVCGKISLTKDYSWGWTIKVNGRQLAQMPEYLRDAKEMAISTLRRETLLANTK